MSTSSESCVAAKKRGSPLSLRLPSMRSGHTLTQSPQPTHSLSSARGYKNPSSSDAIVMARRGHLASQARQPQHLSLLSKIDSILIHPFAGGKGFRLQVFEIFDKQIRGHQRPSRAGRGGDGVYTHRAG
ncbi:hypothetical protein SDC9_109083 [bioreactor metagenome]|uniref:Uncharacterized protein n=1 Tax=bioreactor metagenome TaxID=1076179 RepID=A0A645B9Y7_9ZZZZ